MTKFTPKLAASIVKRIANGVALKDIASSRRGPCPATLAKWRREFPDFDQAIECARDVALVGLIDECVAIADEANPFLTGMEVMTRDGDTEIVFNNGAAANFEKQRQTRILARLDTARILRPARYGPRSLPTGDGGSGPTTVTIINYADQRQQTIIAGPQGLLPAPTEELAHA